MVLRIIRARPPSRLETEQRTLVALTPVALALFAVGAIGCNLFPPPNEELFPDTPIDNVCTAPSECPPQPECNELYPSAPCSADLDPAAPLPSEHTDTPSETQPNAPPLLQPEPTESPSSESSDPIETTTPPDEATPEEPAPEEPSEPPPPLSPHEPDAGTPIGPGRDADAGRPSPEAPRPPRPPRPPRG